MMNKCRFCGEENYNDFYIDSEIDYGALGKMNFCISLEDPDFNESESWSIWFMLFNKDDDILDQKMKINYCPMCGRKLAKDEDNDS